MGAILVKRKTEDGCGKRASGLRAFPTSDNYASDMNSAVLKATGG
jgi:hypothetical protein